MRLFIKLMIEKWNNLTEDVSEAFSQKSAMKFGKSIGTSPKEQGFFDACKKKMKGKVDDPDSFCAAVKDSAFNSTYWRGKGKSASKVKKDTKANPRE